MLLLVMALQLLTRVEVRATLLAIVLVGVVHVRLLMVVVGTGRVRLMRSMSADPTRRGAHGVPEYRLGGDKICVHAQRASEPDRCQRRFHCAPSG